MVLITAYNITNYIMLFHCVALFSAIMRIAFKIADMKILLKYVLTKPVSQKCVHYWYIGSYKRIQQIKNGVPSIILCVCKNKLHTFCITTISNLVTNNIIICYVPTLSWCLLTVQMLRLSRFLVNLAILPLICVKVWNHTVLNLPNWLKLRFYRWRKYYFLSI